jgi:L-fuconolactonase
MTVIDAHQHFWELGRFNYDWLNERPLEPIRNSYLPPDLKTHLDANGVDRSIFVQTQHNLEENRWILQFCEEYDFLAGMVGWVDLAGPDCESQLEEFRNNPHFVGVRHVTHDEPDDDFIIREDIIRGLRVLEKHGVPFDLLFFVKHLKHAQTLGEALPNLPMVIDHLAKPEIKDGRIDNWEANFRAAARFPNIYCKISGMVTEADWKHWKAEDLMPYIEIALEAFGPERCMYGSDWPVCELAGSYERVVGAAREVFGSLSQTEQELIFGGTAQKFYGIR